jgi:anti-sigma B factor antagonist
MNFRYILPVQPDVEGKERSMIRIVEHGDRKIAVLKLIGNPLGEDDALALRQKIHELRDDKVLHVVLDMSEVHHINSAGLGGLLAATFTMLKDNGDVRMAAIGSNVRSIFRMTHLDTVFKTDGTVAESLKTFQQ